jgi:hypothetical protein
MKKNDCFAMKKGTCAVMKETACGKCPFYKTHGQFTESANNINIRLRGLCATTQQYIADKYKHGEICW